MPRTKRVTLMLIFALIFHSGPLYAEPRSLKALVVAQGELGQGETGANNRGPAIRRYLNGKENMPWCTGFISYCINNAGILDFGYPVMAREFYNKAKLKGLVVQVPTPGDLIVFWRGSKNSYQGHIGIIETVKGNTIVTIEGNVGDFPATVKRFEYEIGNIPNLLGFVRIK